MKKLVFLIFLNLLTKLALTQNLVPNPSFEDTLGCPSGYPDLDGVCANWKSFRITPDYMNNCSTVCGYYNNYGYQMPNSGEAYAGIATYQGTDSTAREHIGVQLISPLVIGTRYYVSFYVSPAWNNLLTNIATNKMGLLVTTYQYSDPGGLFPLPNACTIYSDSLIKDTLSWYKIFSSFIADSAYQYLVIGNFFDNAFVDTINFPYQVVPQVAYYYLDDVCLSTDSILTQNWTVVTEKNQSMNNVEIYPNPTSNNFNVRSNFIIEQIEILNSCGGVAFISKEFHDFEITLSSFNLPSDLYFLRIKTKNGFFNTKLIINH